MIFIIQKMRLMLIIVFQAFPNFTMAIRLMYNIMDKINMCRKK